MNVDSNKKEQTILPFKKILQNCCICSREISDDAMSKLSMKISLLVIYSDNDLSIRTYGRYSNTTLNGRELNIHYSFA